MLRRSLKFHLHLVQNAVLWRVKNQKCTKKNKFCSFFKFVKIWELFKNSQIFLKILKIRKMRILKLCCHLPFAFSYVHMYIGTTVFLYFTFCYRLVLLCSRQNTPITSLTRPSVCLFVLSVPYVRAANYIHHRCKRSQGSIDRRTNFLLKGQTPNSKFSQFLS